MTASGSHLGLRLSVAGKPADPALMAGLTVVTIARALDRPTVCALRFAVDPAAVGDPIEIAAPLRIAGSGEETWFDGAVCRIEDETGSDGRTMDVVSADPLDRLQTMQTLEVMDVTSIHRFVRQLAERAGLAFRASTRDFAAGRHVHRFGDDLAFLTGTAGRYGLHVYCRRRTLCLHDLDGDTTPSQDVRVHEAAEDVIRFRRIREPRKARAAALLGWSASDDRSMTAVPIGGDRAIRRLSVPLRQQENTEVLRIAEARRRAADASWQEAELAGVHDAHPGDLLADPADGSRRKVTSVLVSIDSARGATTLISTEPPAPLDRTAPAFYLGKVARIADPDAGGRVRMALDGLGGAVTGWLPVLAPGGGSGSGFGAPLRNGDPALVAAPEGDPELGFVLGGLLRAGGPQEGCISGETRTGMTWRGSGLAVSMDEAKGSLSLRTDDGASVEVANGRVALTASNKLELSCDGRVVIRGSRIDFEEA